MYCISSSLIHSMLYLFASFSTRYLYVYLINARQAKKAINFFLYMFRRNFFPECCMFLLLNFTALHLVIKWRRHHQIRVFFQFRCDLLWIVSQLSYLAIWWAHKNFHRWKPDNQILKQKPNDFSIERIGIFVASS